MDILADYREWVLQQPVRISTHSDDCHMWPRHEKCMVHRLAREVERLRNGAVEWREQLERAADEVEALRNGAPTARETVQCPRCGDFPAPESAAKQDILLSRTGSKAGKTVSDAGESVDQTGKVPERERLTDAERDAIEWAVQGSDIAAKDARNAIDRGYKIPALPLWALNHEGRSSTLRALLERL